MRVQITKLPLDKAAFGKQVQGSLDIQPGTMGGADYTASDKTYYKGVKDTISAVPRDKANLEAEGGETAFGPISGQSIPDHMKIVGKRHHEGGVPLNLPDDTFIFSDTAELKIKEPSVLAMFNKAPKKGGYTPAELAKPYNINKYKTILLDPDTSKLERDTATIMIKNYIMKLGALALVQESMKGFPQGIPTMAKPYMEANGISEEDLMPELKQQADALAQQMPGNNPQMPQEQNPMAAEEMQQMAPEQAMEADQAMMNQGQAQYPQQMPSGAPVASPQTMDQMLPAGAMPPPEMMQQPGMMAYGGMPYAMDGIIMGGTNMPFIMQYGGDLETFQGTDNSQVTVNSTSSSAPISDSSKLGKAYGTGTYTPGQKQAGQTYYDVEGQPKIKGRGWEEGKDVEWSYSGNNGGGSWNPTRQQAIDQYCKNMQNPKSKLFYGVAAEQIAANNFGYLKNSSDPAKQAEYAAILEKLKSCKAGGKQEKYEFVTEDTPPGEDCPQCLDKDGKPILDANGQPVVSTKDPVTGECSPCPPPIIPPEKECYCPDPVTGEDVVVDCKTNCQEFVKNPEPTPIQNLPEDEFNVGVAVASKPVNTPAIQGKSPGVRQQIFGIDYLNEAMLASGMNQGMQKNMAPMLQNNPGGAMAAMFAGNQAAQQNIMGSAARANQFNAGQASSINATNTGWQDKQLTTGMQQADLYNTRKATFDSNVAQDNANYWANVGNKNAIMRGNARELAATNAAQGMKWMVGPKGQEYIVNTNNKQITPEAPDKTIQQQVADYEAAGYTRDQALRAVGLQNKNTKSGDEAKFGGVIYMANGGYVYGTNTYPFEY
jgi:hypothetical protein